jgi:Caudovirus prohead serine protease
VIDYKAELAALLDGVDLELSSEEEIQAEVAELARDRVNEAPVHVKRKAVAAVEAPVDAEGELTGAFEAVVSDYEVDRQGERFSRAGLAPAVEQLRRDGKATPVLYGHAHSDLSAVVGYVPPDGWELTDKELIARGSLDMSDPIAGKLHRLIRAGVLTWSIGFRGGPSRREGDTRVISATEILELSVVPAAANQRARTLSIKANPADLTEAELRDWAEVAGVLPQPKPPSAAALEVKRRQLLRDMGLDEASRRRDASLKKRADYAVMEVALGEDLDAEEQRERKNAALRREVDELRLQAAADFDRDFKGAGDVGPHAREKLRALIRYYMSKTHPWAECVRDNSRRFGPEGAKRVCAVLKDLGEGTTRWRKADTPKRDLEQELWDAADGNLTGLMSMWRDHCLAQGDDPQQVLGEDGLRAAFAMGPRETVKSEPSVKSLMVQLMTGDYQ